MNYYESTPAPEKVRHALANPEKYFIFYDKDKQPIAIYQIHKKIRKSKNETLWDEK